MATTTAVLEHQIDTSLGADIQSYGSGRRYPNVQASCYQPKITDKLELVFGEDSFKTLPTAYQQLWSGNTIETAFSDNSEVETVYKIPNTVRWVFLGIPQPYMRSKETKKVEPLKQGFSMKENNYESCTKVLLAAVDGEELIRTDKSEIQVFTMTLNSTKTNLVDNYRDPDYRSVTKLNNWLIKKFKLEDRKLWLHLASVSLVAEATKFTNTEKSSIGAMYVIKDMPQILPQPLQKDLFTLANSAEIKILLSDPFLVSEKNREALTKLQEANDNSIDGDAASGSSNSDDDAF